MDLSSLVHHLRVLERQGDTTVRSMGRFTAFYPATGLDRHDRDLLYYLRQEVPLRIVVHLVQNPNVSLTEMSHELSLPVTTCHFHMQKLRTAEVIVAETHGSTKHLSLREPGRVLDLVRRYRTTFPQDLVTLLLGRDPTHQARKSQQVGRFWDLTPKVLGDGGVQTDPAPMIPDGVWTMHRKGHRHFWVVAPLAAT